LTDPDENEKLLKSLRLEAAAYMNLEHPNLVRMFDFRDEAVEVKSDGSEVPIAYMVLELVEGGDLHYWIA
jgi:hypothetical protein